MKKALALAIALFSLMLAQPASAQDATIMLAHGIPDTNVDVVVDATHPFAATMSANAAGAARQQA